MTDPSLQGLGPDEVASRQATEGWNELGADARHSLGHIVAGVLREPMFLLLLASGAIYMLLGDAREAAALLGFVAIIMGMTVWQQQRTEKALAALRDLSSPRALVIRGGQTLRIPGREVVRGDLAMLVEGDRVPADGELLEAHDLACDESLLTGECVPVTKFADGGKVAGQVRAGTLVVAGQGLMRVTAIGGRTELGAIGKSIGDIATTDSPLQREFGILTRRLALIGVGISLLTAVLYILSRGDWLHGLLAGITLAMSILPEELPVILIVFLALGARRIARERVLTRRLDAIETLGSTTVLCVDKTGTLTRNRMAVAVLLVEGREIDVASLESLPESHHEVLEYCVLASEIEPFDPMEQAFHRLARETLATTEHLHPDWDLVREYELSPELLAMSHLWQPTDGMHSVVAAKGAPEAIVDLCHLPVAQGRAVMADAARLADRGLRVLAVAKARHPAGAWPVLQHDFDFDFVGLVGLMDPLRADVPAAVAECRGAGIRVVMITGDHPRTARAIAAAAGIDGAEVLTGPELAALPAGELAQRVGRVGVFARVSPQQKLAIVEALKASGELVAMTGDGVNDAPALKAAHIGIAMGKRGTDVAREAAALVLLEDDFGAIVAAIRLGRRVFANLRQALMYTVAVHIPVIGLSVLPLLFGWPLVLAPMHIAFLELVINPACSVVFEAGEAPPGLMARPPRRRDEPLFSRRALSLALLQGVLSSILVAVLYEWMQGQGGHEGEARAMAFIALVAANAAQVMSSRSAGFHPSRLLRDLPPVAWWAFGATFAGLLLVSGVPVLAAAFGFVPPGLGHGVLAWAVGGFGGLVLFEGVKLALTCGPGRPSFP